MPALFLEAIFYIGTFFESTRRWARDTLPVRMFGLLLWTSALLPYLVFSIGAGTFHRNALVLLAVLTGVIAYWYLRLPERFAFDAGFLIVVAAVIISGVFKRIYVVPQGADTHIHMDVLGHLMWIRVAVAVMLLIREWNPGPVSFWPNRSEWKAGVLYYVLAVVPVVGIALGLHFVRFEPVAGPWWRIAGIGVGTFLGFLWVVALSEELFFRGVIQRTLLNHWNSKLAAILVSGLIYGAAHLWLRQFPNWPWLLMTTVLGIVFGILYARSGSIRGPMVAHALVVTTWRLLFQ